MHRFFQLLAACLAMFCAAPCASAQGTVKSGQAIKIEISGVPDSERGQFSVTFPVSESGMINLPYIGQMRAAGLRSDQLASQIQGAYKSRQIYTNPTVQVIISSGDALVEEVVHVGGQVGKTGQVRFVAGLTLYQAVMAAGGPNPFGSMKRVKLYRAGKMRQYDLTQGQFMTVPVEAGDTIEVPQKKIIE